MDENIKYPDQFGDDAKPLASYLKYSKGLQKAIQHVNSPHYKMTSELHVWCSLQLAKELIDEFS